METERVVYKRIYTYAALAVGLVALFFLTAVSGWHGNRTLHTMMEVIATLGALVVGVLALVRFYSKKNNTYLFIGVGFLGTALLDGYHSVVTSDLLDYIMPSPPPSLIPWSWNASRTFLSILMVISWFAWRREEKLGIKVARISEKAVYAFVGVLTVASFSFFAFVPLPRAYYPE